MGEHEFLANGNILITESEGGRVFEINPNGKIVWEFINRYDDDHVAIIEQGLRYPESFAEFTTEECQ